MLSTSDAKNALLKQYVLDEIASGETTRATGEGYNILYGGDLFNTKDHPNVKHPLEDGRYTTAAGRYQFLYPTWMEQKNALNLGDFSNPANQDLAAWNLASETYRKGTGRELLDDAANGEIDWEVLKPVWPSLVPSSEEVPKATAKTSAAPASARSGMSVSDLPQFLQTFRKNYTFTPVDYDPFAVLESQNG